MASDSEEDSSIDDIELEKWNPFKLFLIRGEPNANSYEEFLDRMIEKYGKKPDQQLKPAEVDVHLSAESSSDELPLTLSPPSTSETNLQKSVNETPPQKQQNQKQNPPRLKTPTQNVKTDGKRVKRTESALLLESAGISNSSETSDSPNRKGRKRKFSETEKGPKNETPVKRNIPIHQQQKLPPVRTQKIFGDRRSILTRKQHEIHNAVTLNFQKTGKFQSDATKKEHAERKRNLLQEHWDFNETLKNAMKNEARKYDYANPTAKRFVKNMMIQKRNRFDQLPQKYEKIDELKKSDGQPLTRSSPLPQLEFKKMLTETSSKPPRVVLPHLEQLCHLKVPEIPRDLFQESITDDKTIDLYIEKYAPNFIMSTSSAKTLFSSYGPLACAKWHFPVVIVSKFVQGQKQKLVFMLKTLPPCTVDNIQNNWYSAKYSLRKLFCKLGKTSGKECRQYSLWSFKHYDVLIRSNVDGEYKSPTDAVAKNVRATFLPKMEYQWEYGAEELRRDEAVYHWWTAFLKHSDVHLRVRVAATSNHICAIEELKADSALRLNNLKTEIRSAIGEGMINASHILEKLIKLDDGNYIISYDGEQSEYKIFREVASEANCDLDLSKIYNDEWLMTPTKRFEIDDVWMPIDSEVLLQWHRIKKRIPATFPPVDEIDKGSPKKGRKQQKQQKSSKKSKKKKNKKQNKDQSTLSTVS